VAACENGELSVNIHENEEQTAWTCEM